MRKLQQFYVGKFLSGRLANTNFEIKRETINTLREKQELVSLADSQVLRTIRHIRYSREDKEDYEGEKTERYNQDILEGLIREKKRLLKVEPQNRKEKIQVSNAIRKIGKKINEILYIPEYVLVTIESKSHYRTIIKKGLYINGKKYIRLLCSAGMARNNTVALIREDFEKELKKYLKNDMKEDILITENKYNAYFALASTATHTLSTPKVLLVDDCERTMEKKIDWAQKLECTQPLENKEKIVTIHKELEFNFFDGGGLIDITKAEQWAKELKLDYIPSVFIIRNIFIKGCLFTVDFRKFAREIAKIKTIKDLYGNEQIIDQCDIILTKSQFKMANAYESMEDYQAKCDKNLNYWGISRVSPKKDDEYFTTNYQFLQVLDLDEEDIKELCQPTIDWLKGIAGMNRNTALLFMMGKMLEKEGSDPNEILKQTSDNMAKSLIINPKMIEEESIRQNLIQSINKKIKEAYIGKLIVKGCFNTMIPDPYALMEWAFGMEVKGLLAEGEHYSKYWNQRGSTDVVAMRSPLTWRSEVNKLTLIKNEKTEEWYKYLDSGTVFNVWGLDCVAHADSDYDGDIVATTNNPVFLRCRDKESLPITYKKSTVSKKRIEEKNLYKADLDSFDTTIGQITNYSTSFYDLLYKFKNKMDDYSKKCYKEIIERLKLTRVQQGNAIDAAKGIKSDPYPSIWINKQRIEDTDSEEIRQKKQFLNDICGDRKPYFFIHRYPQLKRDYENYLEIKKANSYIYFGKQLEEILGATEDELTEEEREFKRNYEDYCPVINYHSPMNMVCEYLEKELEIIKDLKQQKNSEDIIRLMQTENKEVDLEGLEKIKEFYNSYNCKKRDLKIKQNFIIKNMFQKESVEDNIVNIEQYAKQIRFEAEEYFSANCGKDKTISETIADTVVEYCYIKYPSKSKSFAWNVFGKYILENIKNNTLKQTQQTTIPFVKVGGNIDYLCHNFEEIVIDIENNKEQKEGVGKHDNI